jgi:hypothetical protein
MSPLEALSEQFFQVTILPPAVSRTNKEDESIALQNLKSRHWQESALLITFHCIFLCLWFFLWKKIII